MESQPQNPELRNNPENFHPCTLWFRPLDKETVINNYLFSQP